METYLDDFTNIPVDDVAIKTVHLEMEKQNIVMSVAGIILRINRDCS